MLEDLKKLVNPAVHAAYIRVLMGGTCTGTAMKDGKCRIICQGRHEDTVTRWLDCRVCKQWMNLLDMAPSEYSGMTRGCKVFNFLGLTAHYANSNVQFNAMCIAFLMNKALNDSRHRSVGVDFSVGNEKDTTDWAALVLAGASHGHPYMSNELTARQHFGYNMAREIINEKKKKDKQFGGHWHQRGARSQVQTGHCRQQHQRICARH